MLVLSKLSYQSWYAIVAISIVILLLAVFITLYIVKWVALLSTYAVLKYLIYSYLPLSKTFNIYVSLWYTLLGLLYAGSNSLCIAWRVQSRADLSIRCGSILATNLIFLFPGASIAADILKITRRSYERAHTIIGTVSGIEAIIHVILQFADSGWINDQKTISGTIAISCIAILSLASIHYMHKRTYELFRICHFASTTLLCGSFWVHVSDSTRLARVQAIILLSVYLSSYLYRWLNIIYRNFFSKRTRTTLTLHNTNGVLKASITMPRPWEVKPGQHIYLTVPKLGLLSCFQRHPFMVAQSEDYNCVDVIIEPKQGFTRRLLETKAASMHALIEGPYGRGFNFHDFGTVVLFASGIGIAGFLSSVLHLVREYRRSTIVTRDILLIWTVNTDSYYDSVKDFMNEVLLEDKELLPIHSSAKAERFKEGLTKSVFPGRRPKPTGQNVMDIFIYRDDLLKDHQIRRGERLAEIGGSPNIPEIISDVVGTRVGRIAFSACAEPNTRDLIRRTVVEHMHKDVRYIELDFQP